MATDLAAYTGMEMLGIMQKRLSRNQEDQCLSFGGMLATYSSNIVSRLCSCHGQEVQTNKVQSMLRTHPFGA